MRNHRRAGSAKTAGIAIVALLIVGGAFAYRYMFGRPGEAAIQLIPNDATFVMTLDSHPSPLQAPLFQRIGDAIRREKLDEEIDKAFTSMSNGMPVPKNITKELDNSFALAMWIDKPAPPPAPQPGVTDAPGGMPPANMPPNPFDNPNIAVFVATKSAEKVQTEIEKEGDAVTIAGHKCVKFKTGDGFATLIGQHFVITTTEALLKRIIETKDDPKGSVAELAEFKAARASLPSDANWMFFVAPKGIKTFQDQAKAIGGTNTANVPTVEWMAASATLRNEGVQFDYYGPADSTKSPALKALGEIAALNPATFDKLPAGAYGVTGYSQLGKYVDMTTEMMKGSEGVTEEMNKSLESLKEETGLDLHSDIVPALNGNMILAVYPDAKRPTESVDIVAVIDEANGADPATLAEKVRQIVEKKLAEEAAKHPTTTTPAAGSQELMTSRTYGDVTCWSLNDTMRNDLVEGVSGSMGSKPPKLSPADEAMYKKYNIPPPQPSGPSKSDINHYTDGKTFTYAVIGKSVIVASSEAMLNTAIDAWNGKAPGLGTDTKFASMRKSIQPSSQAVLMVSIGRVLEALRPMMDKQTAGGPIATNDILSIFGGPDAGMAFSGGYDGKIARGTALLPVDFERLATVIGKMVKSSSQPPAQRPGLNTL
jgi:hypothetical protein